MERKEEISGRILSDGFLESQIVLKEGDLRLYAFWRALRVLDCFERGDLRLYILWRAFKVSINCLLLLLHGASLVTKFSWLRFGGRTHSADFQKRYRDRRLL